MEGWVDLAYPTMQQPGFEIMIAWSRVQRPNHYTTEPPVNDVNQLLLPTGRCDSVPKWMYRNGPYSDRSVYRSSFVPMYRSGTPAVPKWLYIELALPLYTYLWHNVLYKNCIKNFVFSYLEMNEYTNGIWYRIFTDYFIVIAVKEVSIEMIHACFH